MFTTTPNESCCARSKRNGTSAFRIKAWFWKKAEKLFFLDRSGQTLRDHEWIVAQCGKDFAQHFRLLRVTRDALHLGLELVRSDRPLPVILQRLRVAQIVFDLLLDRFVRHHFIQRRLCAGICRRPNAMLPIDFLDRVLIRDAIRETQGFGLICNLPRPAKGGGWRFCRSV